MTSIMRRTVRGAATGLGALAIVAGASACGGLLGGEDEGGDGTVTEEDQPAEEEGDAPDAEEEGDAPDAEEEGDAPAAEEEGDDAAASEGEEGAAGGELSEDDLTAGSERFVEFMQVLDDDAAGACEMIFDPTTGGAPSKSFVETCAPGLEAGFEGQGIELQPGMFDTIDASMIELTDNGDGSAAVTMAGQSVNMGMVKADDGEWYVQANM
ncbi:hypothetical protein [Brachybacterium sp. FME24]|uniref:hypothetical protein n=1 Tax=Brachybacterium sp. FME24 TaxID=2742605 RepID=UPI0018691FBD|nr:hypothetical protein [Brachybacterium sp. FME24]